MPVRIYDISKRLGLENKEVLAKAKELGIAGARVASSSLDKITAGYLEDKLKEAHPELAAPPPARASAASASRKATPTGLSRPRPSRLGRLCLRLARSPPRPKSRRKRSPNYPHRHRG